MKLKSLRSKNVNKELEGYDISLSKKDRVELKDNTIILVNGEPSFFYHEEKLLPTLRYILSHTNPLKEIIVDMGAVKFIACGADVMRPGIVEIDLKIKQGEVVVVLDVKNRKPLVIGIALYNGKEMLSLDSGKVIKNIHYIGDNIWNA